jgi:hypothetical protein
MSAGEVERALADCGHSDTNDGSPQMDDVDCACVVDDEREERRIWVATDWDCITERDGGGG